MKSYFFSVVFLFSYLFSFGQDEAAPPPNKFIRSDIEYGYVFQTDDFLRGNNLAGGAITQTLGGRIELGWQARGRNVYDNILKYPAYGFGILTYGFPQTGELGEPNALYLFMDNPFKRWGDLSFNYFIRLGMSYNWSPNDPAVNPFNLVLGSYRNLYISAGVQAEYSFGTHMVASLGVGFSHFSNGQSSLPNSGMNLLTPNLGIKYNFNEGVKTDYKELPIPEFNDKALEFYFTIGSGIRQIFYDSAKTGVPTKLGVSYPVHNISTALQYQYAWAGKFGGGLDFIYWGAQDPGIELGPGNIVQAKEVPFKDKLQLGVFISYEFVLNNISIYAQPGFRVLRTEYKGMPPDFYQHLALKYHVHDLILGVAIRAVNFGQAEYIEWNIGYRFRKPVK